MHDTPPSRVPAGQVTDTERGGIDPGTDPPLALSGGRASILFLDTVTWSHLIVSVIYNCSTSYVCYLGTTVIYVSAHSTLYSSGGTHNSVIIVI